VAGDAQKMLLHVSYLGRLVVEVVGELDFSEAEVELKRDGVVQVLVEVERVHHALCALRCFVFSKAKVPREMRGQNKGGAGRVG